MGSHFWPFTDVLQEIRREVTWKLVANLSTADDGDLEGCRFQMNCGLESLRYRPIPDSPPDIGLALVVVAFERSTTSGKWSNALIFLVNLYHDYMVMTS